MVLVVSDVSHEIRTGSSLLLAKVHVPKDGVTGAPLR
jgi:hypothetical protein